MALRHLSRRLPAATRLVAAIVVAVAACALLGAPAFGRPHSRPVALATGTSDALLGPPGRLPGRWRLEGRRLTLRLSQPLVLFHPPLPSGRLTAVRLTAECGENTVPLNMFDSAYPWAAVTSGAATVSPTTRVVRITLASDLAGRANLCSIAITGPPSTSPPFFPLFVDQIRASMTVRRGRIRTCAPGPLERVLLDSPRIRVTVAHSTDGGSTVDGFRACLPPHGTPLQIDRAGDEGGAGGHGTSAERFTAAGTWLAWADGYHPHSDLGGGASWTIRLVDMTVRRPRSIDTGPGTAVAVAVGASGAVAWVDEPNLIEVPAQTPDGSPVFYYPAAELRAQRPGGSTIVLDQTAPAACAIGCHVDTGAELTNLGVSPDGRTITWTHSGTPRSAALP